MVTINTTDAEESMLTTVDNPYNPFTEFSKWLEFDRTNGYYTSEYLARIAISSSELSEDQQRQAINNAIDEIVKVNPFGIHKKIVKQLNK